MTAQATVGVLAGTTITVLVLYALLWHRWRADAVERGEYVRHIEHRLRDSQRAHRADLERRVEAGARAAGMLEAERRAHRGAQERVAELERALEARRAGPIVEGETVALTTPGDRTIRGVVRQTFDNGAVLLGAATVYTERVGRDGVEVEELNAGDVVVPAHRWAQKLPPAPEED